MRTRIAPLSLVPLLLLLTTSTASPSTHLYVCFDPYAKDPAYLVLVSDRDCAAGTADALTIEVNPNDHTAVVVHVKICMMEACRTGEDDARLVLRA